MAHISATMTEHDSLHLTPRSTCDVHYRESTSITDALLRLFRCSGELQLDELRQIHPGWQATRTYGDVYTPRALATSMGRTD